MRRGRWLVAVLLCFGLQPAAFGWGNDGHQLVNRAAAGRIPLSMPKFMRKAADRLEYLGPEPDRWRHVEELAVKNAQEPDHFIDLERVADVPELPRGRYAFYRLLYEKRAHGAMASGVKPDDLLPERVGLQPYIAMEVYDRLKIAFREYRHLKAGGKSTSAVEQNAVFYAGWLGHYVADGANPLHTTVNYNGWVGENPNGYTTEHKIHWQMEGQFVTDNLAQLQISETMKPPTALADPWQDYIKYLRASNTEVEKVYQLEKAGGFKGEGTADSRAFIRQRLALGAQMLVNLWYTAWLESEKEPAKPKYD